MVDIETLIPKDIALKHGFEDLDHVDSPSYGLHELGYTSLGRSVSKIGASNPLAIHLWHSEKLHGGSLTVVRDTVEVLKVHYRLNGQELASFLNGKEGVVVARSFKSPYLPSRIGYSISPDNPFEAEISAVSLGPGSGRFLDRCRDYLDQSGLPERINLMATWRRLLEDEVSFEDLERQLVIPAS